MVACTRNGKVVGWQLLQAAFEDSQSPACILHGVESSPSKGVESTQATESLNGHSKRGAGQTVEESTSSSGPPERGSSSGSLESGKAGRSGKGQPPEQKVSIALSVPQGQPLVSPTIP